MGRAQDAERLKELSRRIAAAREELAVLRAERTEVLARLRTLPGGAPGSGGRTAVRVVYGEAGEGMLLVDLPGKAVAVPGTDAPSPPAGSPGRPDRKDR